MKILRKNIDQTISLNKSTDFRTDAGWSENIKDLETELLVKIINPIENYETVRFIHEPYLNGNGLLQTDIWFKFFFYDGENYICDYLPTGILLNENSGMLRQSTESFFRLEFFKTSNNEQPSRTNRRLVFAKNLSLPIGEKVLYNQDGRTYNIFKPVFTGNNYRNKENVYFFWFQDDTVLNETTLTGNTFFMTAKFYNAKDGSISDFVKSDIDGEVNETNDMYYKVVIEKDNYTYVVLNNDERIGLNTNTFNPIVFYERK
jgi:hypothetical protein